MWQRVWLPALWGLAESALFFSLSKFRRQTHRAADWVFFLAIALIIGRSFKTTQEHGISPKPTYSRIKATYFSFGYFAGRILPYQIFHLSKVPVYSHPAPATLGRSRQSTRQLRRTNRKVSEYGLQLKEKQKAKFIYGVLERQFRGYYDKAKKMSGVTGENLLSLLERRLDNVVFRLGLANTRRQARQLVRHGHFTVNGKRVDIPSALVREGDVIEVAEKSRASAFFKELKESSNALSAPAWLTADQANLTGTVTRFPHREEIDVPVNEQAIVELYSK